MKVMLSERSKPVVASMMSALVAGVSTQTEGELFDEFCRWLEEPKGPECTCGRCPPRAADARSLKYAAELRSKREELLSPVASLQRLRLLGEALAFFCQVGQSTPEIESSIFAACVRHAGGNKDAMSGDEQIAFASVDPFAVEQVGRLLKVCGISDKLASAEMTTEAELKAHDALRRLKDVLRGAAIVI